MKRAVRPLLALLLTLAVLATLLPSLPRSLAAETRYTLPVFETSDIHGHLVDSSSGNQSTYAYRLAYIADKVDDARGGDPSRTVLLDGGDIYQGNVVSNLQNGWPMSAAFDAMEYDAVGLGNHEFDWGIDITTDPDGTMPAYTLNGETHDNDIPILCCNIFERSSGRRVNFTQDYVILEKTAVSESGDTLPVRVAVVGYVNNYASSIMASRFANYTIRSGVYQAENIARTLLSEGRADAAILLTHADAEDVAYDLSASSPFSLVCGGHSHMTETGTANGVRYMEPGAKGGFYGYAALSFNADGSLLNVGTPSIYTVSNSSCYNTAANQSSLAPDVMAVSRAALAGVEEALNTSLGYITTSVTGQAINGNDMSTTGGNWMTDLANRATGSEVSFTNSGGIRTSFYVNSGKRYITKGDIFTIAPFNNRLYVYDVSYLDLLSVLQYALGRGSGLGMRMSGIDCYYSGSSVTALVRDGECIYKDGKWKDGFKTQLVRISANEFIATSSSTPFYQWNGTAALVSDEQIDNESFITVLEEEGRANDGFLYVDPDPHMINGSYSGEITNYYEITTECTEGGTVTPGAHVAAGSSFTVTITPDAGWEIEDVIVDGGSRGPIPSITFGNVHGNHTLKAFFRKLPPVDPCAAFTDLEPGKWYYEAAGFALSNGLFQGTSETTFDPNGTMTRGMLVTVLWRMTGSPSGSGADFTDVEVGRYYSAAVGWAAENGIVAGYPDGSFRPGAPVTREQLATFLLRYARAEGRDDAARASLDAFPDAAELSNYALEPMCWAVAEGLIGGVKSGDTVLLSPKAPTTRAQVATVLMRYAFDPE